MTLCISPENGPIFLVKENNVTSEQTFLISVQVTDSAPVGIQSATIDLDYRIGSHGVTTITELFPPSQQRIPFRFELCSDTLPEGTEAFQASVSPEDTRKFTDENGTMMVEQYPTSLNPSTLSSEIFITILDDDRKFQTHCIFLMECYLFTCSGIRIGFTNTNYTVDEGIGILLVDIQVFSVPNEQPLPVIVELVIESVPGSACKCTELVYLKVSISLYVYYSFSWRK
jgi:hypothetical protein